MTAATAEASDALIAHTADPIAARSGPGTGRQGLDDRHG
jgi:hypothetical protein